MRRNSYRKNYIAIVILMIIVCTVSVVYAALTKSVNTNVKKVTQQPFTYDTIVVSGAVLEDSQGMYKYCGSISVTNDYLIEVTSVKMRVGLECKYSISIKNTSNNGLKSRLLSITPIYATGLSGCSYSNPAYYGCNIPGSNSGRIRYALSSSMSFSPYLNAGGLTINSGETKTIYLRINTNATFIDEQVTANGGGFKLTFTAI